MLCWILTALGLPLLFHKGVQAQTSDSPPDDGLLEVWQWVVILVGGGLFLVIICVAVICCCKRSRRSGGKYAQNLDMALRLEDPDSTDSHHSSGVDPKISQADFMKGRSTFGTTNFRPAFATNVQSIISAANGPTGGVNPAFMSNEDETYDNNMSNREEKQEVRTRTYVEEEDEDDFRSKREDIYERYLEETRALSNSNTSQTSETNLDSSNLSDNNAKEEITPKENVRETTKGNDEVYSRDEHFLY